MCSKIIYITLISSLSLSLSISLLPNKNTQPAAATHTHTHQPPPLIPTATVTTTHNLDHRPPKSQTKTNPKPIHKPKIKSNHKLKPTPTAISHNKPTPKKKPTNATKPYRSERNKPKILVQTGLTKSYSHGACITDSCSFKQRGQDDLDKILMLHQICL